MVSYIYVGVCDTVFTVCMNTHIMVQLRCFVVLLCCAAPLAAAPTGGAYLPGSGESNLRDLPLKKDNSVECQADQIGLLSPLSELQGEHV